MCGTDSLTGLWSAADGGQVRSAIRKLCRSIFVIFRMMLDSLQSTSLVHVTTYGLIMHGILLLINKLISMFPISLSSTHYMGLVCGVKWSLKARMSLCVSIVEGWVSHLVCGSCPTSAVCAADIKKRKL